MVNQLKLFYPEGWRDSYLPPLLSSYTQLSSGGYFTPSEFAMTFNVALVIPGLPGPLASAKSFLQYKDGQFVIKVKTTFLAITGTLEVAVFLGGSSTSGNGRATSSGFQVQKFYFGLDFTGFIQSVKNGARRILGDWLFWVLDSVLRIFDIFQIKRIYMDYTAASQIFTVGADLVIFGISFSPSLSINLKPIIALLSGDWGGLVSGALEQLKSTWNDRCKTRTGVGDNGFVRQLVDDKGYWPWVQRYGANGDRCGRDYGTNRMQGFNFWRCGCSPYWIGCRDNWCRWNEDWSRDRTCYYKEQPSWWSGTFRYTWKYSGTITLGKCQSSLNRFLFWTDGGLCGKLPYVNNDGGMIFGNDCRNYKDNDRQECGESWPGTWSGGWCSCYNCPARPGDPSFWYSPGS